MGSQFEAAGDRIAGVLAAIFLPLLYFDWWGFFAFLIFRLLTGNDATPSDTTKFAITATIVVHAIIGIICIVMAEMKVQEKRKARERAAKKEAERAAEEAARNAREKRAHLAWIAKNLTENSESAIQAMEYLPGWLTEANNNARLAVVHYQDGAFSPFWSDIEQAYRCLAGYRESVLAIGQAADRHAVLMEDMLREGGDPSPYSRFPIALDGEKIKNVLNDATQNLESITYEAQKDPVFAQIWEQRRTTSAVVTGFANLEAAVRDMGRSIAESIENMGREISNSNVRVKSTLETVASNTSLHLLDASREQAEAMRRLTSKVEEVKKEIYYRNWGHYSILG